MTHAGGRLGLGMSRGLKSAPEDVHVIAADGGKYDLHRSIGDERVQLPMAGSDAYLPVVKDIIRDKRPDLFWPAHDGEIAKVAADPELSDMIFLPSVEMIRVCHSKTESYDRFVAAGVPVPRSIPINDHKDLARAFDQLGDEIWVRATTGVGGRGSLAVTDFDTAKLWIDFHKGWGSFQAAERLPGQRLAWESVWLEGELVFCQGVVPEAIGFSNLTLSGITGIPALNRWVSNPVMDANGKAAIKAIHDRPHGIMTVDMTIHADGKPRVTEVNIGRFGSGGVVHSRVHGHNLPYLILQLAAGEEPEMALPALNIFPNDWWVILGFGVEPIEVHMDVPNATEDELNTRLEKLGFGPTG